MARDWVAISIAVGGIVLGTGLFGPPIISFISQPNVQIIGPKLLDDRGYKALFTMYNFGVTAAKHLKLTIKTPLKINTIYSNFSTENMSLKKNNDTLVGLLPRFARNGDNTLLDEWLERFRDIDAINKY
jgi:hypothetical protein